MLKNLFYDNQLSLSVKPIYPRRVKPKPLLVKFRFQQQ